jgi:hypothetical protein
VGSLVYGWGLITNVVVIIPVSVAIFLLSSLFAEGDPSYAAKRDRLFERLNTPVDVARELKDSSDLTRPVFRFLSRITGGVGVLTLLLLFTVPAGDRMTVIAYAGITLVLAFLMRFVKGATA